MRSLRAVWVGEASIDKFCRHPERARRGERSEFAKGALRIGVSWAEGVIKRDPGCCCHHSPGAVDWPPFFAQVRVILVRPQSLEVFAGRGAEREIYRAPGRRRPFIVRTCSVCPVRIRSALETAETISAIWPSGLRTFCCACFFKLALSRS